MRRTLRAAVAGVVAAGLVLAVAAPASAHNYVVESTPADDEVLTELPSLWALTTNDTLLYVDNPVRFGLWARDADGLYYGDGCVDVSGAEMTAVPAIGAAGAYTLVYAFISADGHPLTGEIPFEWAPTGEVAPATGTTEPTVCGELPAETPEAGEEDPGTAAPGIPSDVWWIIAAVGAVVVAAVGTLLLARRRPRPTD